MKTLEKEITQIELELPQEAEIEESIELQLEKLKDNGLHISLNDETEAAWMQELLGLTGGEISNVIAKAVSSCRGLNADFIKVSLEEKKNVIRGSGSLTYTLAFAEVLFSSAVQNCSFWTVSLQINFMANTDKKTIR